MPAVDTVTTFDEVSGASPAAEASERMRSEHVHLPPRSRTYVLSQYERIAFRTCADHVYVCGLLCVTVSRVPLILPLCERPARSAARKRVRVSEIYVYD